MCTVYSSVYVHCIVYTGKQADNIFYKIKYKCQLDSLNTNIRLEIKIKTTKIKKHWWKNKNY